MPPSPEPASVTQSGDCLRARPIGTLSVESVNSLERQLRQRLDSRAPRSLAVLIDLREAGGFDLEIRGALVELQRLLAARSRRTAYVSDRAHLRGLALWAMGRADDQNAKVFMSLEAAEEWLGSQGGRLDDAQRRTLAAVEAAGGARGAASRPPQGSQGRSR